jgi:hydrogenase expression/formation protein HypE
VRPERARRRPKFRDDVVTLAHGSGGKATRALVEAVFVDAFDNPLLAPLADSAVLEANGSRLAFTTDSYVVKPIFFPGGDIGELAVNGTINDLAVAGAQPLALSAGFVIEEGLSVADLRRIAASVGRAAAVAGVPVATGDTKVVERGKADGLYLTTSGVGLLAPGVTLGPEQVRAGDRVLVSGTIGDHGTAVMIARGELELEVELESDTAPVHELAQSLLALGEAIRWMRDPTRGGLATALNELAQQAGVAVVLDERALPVRPAVVGTCEILGIDPVYVASEGRLIAVVAADAAEEALRILRADPLGADAAAIGEIRTEPEELVVMETAFGGSRIVDMLVGDPLPRIC